MNDKLTDEQRYFAQFSGLSNERLWVIEGAFPVSIPCSEAFYTPLHEFMRGNERFQPPEIGDYARVNGNLYRIKAWDIRRKSFVIEWDILPEGMITTP